jgi:hypothetical protein
MHRQSEKRRPTATSTSPPAPGPVPRQAAEKPDARVPAYMLDERAWLSTFGHWQK